MANINGNASLIPRKVSLRTLSVLISLSRDLSQLFIPLRCHTRELPILYDIADLTYGIDRGTWMVGEKVSFLLAALTDCPLVLSARPRLRGMPGSGVLMLDAWRRPSLPR